MTIIVCVFRQHPRAFVPIIDQSTSNKLLTDIDAEQTIKQIQECSINKNDISAIDNTVICSEDAEQQIFLHTVGGERVFADINQNTLQKNNCDINLISSCTDKANDIVSIAQDFTGGGEAAKTTSIVSNIDTDIQQTSSQNNDCSIEDVNGISSSIINCQNFKINRVVIAPILLGEATSAVSNLNLDTYQKLSQDNHCSIDETSISSSSSSNNNCVNNGDNAIIVAIPPIVGSVDVSNLNLDTYQKSVQDNHCSIDETIIAARSSDCENFGTNGIVIATGLEQATSAVSNLNLDTYQKLSQDNQCTDTTSCNNDGENLISIDESLLSRGGTIRTATVSNVDADVKQVMYEDNVCNNSINCNSRSSNTLKIGSSGNMGGGSINLSNVDVDVKQVLSDNNECSGNIDTDCNNNIPSNTVLIGSGDIRFTEVFGAGVSTVSDIDLDNEQKVSADNHCYGGTSCSNGGGNLVSIGSSAALQFGSIINLSDVDANVKQVNSEANDCNGINVFCSNGSLSGTNDVSIGDNDLLAEGSIINLSDVDANIDQNIYSYNQCEGDNTGCETNGRNSVSIGHNFVAVTSTVSNIDADTKQELSVNNYCADGASCDIILGNTVDIGTSSGFLVTTATSSFVSDINADAEQKQQ